MRKIFLVISLISVFCAFNIATDALAGPNPYALGQETYLLQKIDKGTDPWTIIRPESAAVGTTAFGKLEYFNYGEEFSFDFKGYDFLKVDALSDLRGDPLMPANGEYALIYYDDPGVGWPNGLPAVYVLGISTAPYVQSAKGKALGLVGVDIKISGSCPIEQIPYADDVNYPNGGKIWLVPLTYVEAKTACTATTWTTSWSWPAGGAGILFETSLITYGFEFADEE